MSVPSFSWSQSLVQKVGILTFGILCLVVLGWPISEPRNSVVQQSSIAEEPDKSEIAHNAFSQATLPTGQSLRAQVDLNTGTLEDFKQLPGIGVVLAQRIVDYRQAHGHYKAVGALHSVSGIGKARIARLRPLVTVNIGQPHEKVIEALSQAS